MGEGERFVTTRAGPRIHFESTGTGDPILLVHGWGSNARQNWVQPGFVAALSPTRRVVTLDIRGHGRSDKPRVQSAYAYAAMASDVLSVMDHLEIERADFLGYSMGSFIGAWLLGHERTRIRSMVLGGFGGETPESLADLPRIVAGLRALDPSRLVDPLAKGYRAFADSDADNDREALALAALEMWPQGDPLDLVGPDAAEIDIPVLVVNGSDDHPYVDTVGRFLDAIRGSEQVVLSGCDHLTCVGDPRFVDAVVRFCAGRAGDQAVRP